MAKNPNIQLTKDIEKFIEVLNYDLKECDRLYASMEYYLELDKEIKPRLIDRFRAYQARKIKKTQKTARQIRFTKLIKETTDGNYKNFHSEFYGYKCSIFDMRDMDADLRYRLMGAIRNASLPHARQTLIEMYKTVRGNFEDLKTIAKIILFYLNNYEEVEQKDLLTFEDIKNIAN